MTDQKIRQLEEYLQKNANKIKSNMIKKYMFLLIKEGKQSFQEALKIQYKRPDQRASMEELNKLVAFIQNALAIKDDKELAYALGTSARILAAGIRK